MAKLIRRDGIYCCLQKCLQMPMLKIFDKQKHYFVVSVPDLGLSYEKKNKMEVVVGEFSPSTLQSNIRIFSANFRLPKIRRRIRLCLIRLKHYLWLDDRWRIGVYVTVTRHTSLLATLALSSWKQTTLRDYRLSLIAGRATKRVLPSGVRSCMRAQRIYKTLRGRRGRKYALLARYSGRWWGWG